MDKIEGFAIAADVKMFVSNDIDGVEVVWMERSLGKSTRSLKQAVCTKFGEDLKRSHLDAPLQFN